MLRCAASIGSMISKAAPPSGPASRRSALAGLRRAQDEIVDEAICCIGTGRVSFVRAIHRSFETNVPTHVVKELALGIEWQLISALEIVAEYDMAHRKVYTKKLYDEKGHVIRCQIQFNYWAGARAARPAAGRAGADAAVLRTRSSSSAI